MPDEQGKLAKTDQDQSAPQAQSVQTSGQTISATPVSPGGLGIGPASINAARELYWQNVIRELLVDLAAIRLRRPASTTVGPYSAPASEPDFFDGRLAIITTQGQRIPISSVEPAVPCSTLSRGPDGTQTLAHAVECTVFRIATPTGDSYTLPLHEIAGFHAMSNEMVQRISQAAAGTSDPEPFGFAAFTSLAKDTEPPAPVHTTTITGPGIHRSSAIEPMASTEPEGDSA